MVKSKKIKAVHSVDLVSLLEGLELWDDMLKGKINCVCCNKTLSLEDIGCIFPKGNDIKFCCTDFACLNILSELEEEREN